jgi:hypothetical protein
MHTRRRRTALSAAYGIQSQAEKTPASAPAAGVRQPPTKKPRCNVGVIAAPAMVEVAM